MGGARRTIVSRALGSDISLAIPPHKSHLCSSSSPRNSLYPSCFAPRKLLRVGFLTTRRISSPSSPEQRFFRASLLLQACGEPMGGVVHTVGLCSKGARIGFELVRHPASERIFQFGFGVLDVRIVGRTLLEHTRTLHGGRLLFSLKNRGSNLCRKTSSSSKHEENWPNECDEHTTMVCEDALELGEASRLNDSSVGSWKSDLASNITVIAFDIETTGFNLSDDRIVEFAARDLAGGECSTLQTLVNPERAVPSYVSCIHGINTEMVSTPEVPRWKEVAPIIVQFVESRRQDGGPVILVAHNGKRFDVPFIVKEFQNCSLQVPSWWQFVDTVPLAREAMKANGLKRPPLRLTALHEHYGLPFLGRAHRALADVHMLAFVLQKIMIDLKMPVSGLIEKAFTVQDILLSARFQGIADLNIQEEPDDDGSSVAEVEGLIEDECSTEDLLTECIRVPWEDEVEDSYVMQLGKDEENGLLESSPESSALDELDLLESASGSSAWQTGHEIEEIISEAPSARIDILEDSVGPVIMPTDLQGQELVRETYSRQSTEEHMDSLISVGQDDQITADGMYGQQIGSSTMTTSASVPYSHASCESLEILKTLLQMDTVDMHCLSPMIKQYVETKLQRPQSLLLSRVGDFYEAFFEDAEKLAEACNVRLTAVDGGKLLGRKVPMAGVPYHRIENYLQTLLSKGISVVKQDQVDVGDSRDGNLLERRVTAVLTPGTVLVDGMLEGHRNNYLVSIMPPEDDNGTWGLAYSDISTGELFATQAQGRQVLADEMLRLQPSEVIFPGNATSIRNTKTGDVQPVGLVPELCYLGRPASDFYPASAKKRLQRCIAAGSMDGFTFERLPLAVRAAGGLLGYIEETQRLFGQELPLRKPVLYSIRDSLLMNESVRTHLELVRTALLGKTEGSLIWALDHTKTSMGSRMLKKWLLRPLIKHDKISTRLDAVEILVEDNQLRTQVCNHLSSLNDIERLAGRVAWNRAIARDLLAIAQSIKLLPLLSADLEKAPANPYFSAATIYNSTLIELAHRVETLLVEQAASKRSDGGLIKDNVDEDLDILRSEIRNSEKWIHEYEKEEQRRTGITSLQVGYNKSYGHFICIKKSKLMGTTLPSDYQLLESLKNEERYVTSDLMKCEKRRMQTIAKASEREEELVATLKDEMVLLVEPIRKISEALAALDVLCTFAELAATRCYCKPQMLEGSREITIVSGRHPVVEISLQSRGQFVANSVYMGHGLTIRDDSVEEQADYQDPSLEERGDIKGQTRQIRNIEKSSCFKSEGSSQFKVNNSFEGEQERFWPRADLIILTGPNSSGKSCYLRQVGLIQILAQMGSFVPATEARLGVADAVYTRVGAVDDLAAGQSTFKIEMIESAYILNHATSKSLVLLDEVGRGTGSQEGGAIARAIIEYLAQTIKARTVFSTHYHHLHVLDTEFSNIANYHFESIEKEDGSLVFEHCIKPGFAIQSYAVAVSRVAGLPEWVCNRAAELLSSHKSIDQDTATFEENIEGEASFVKDVKREDWIPTSGSQPSITAMSTQTDFKSMWGRSPGGSWRKTKGTGSIFRLSASSRSGQTDLLSDSELTEENQEQEYCLSKEELNDVWKCVCKVLQAQPATHALAKQKGSLMSITMSTEATHVCIGASALFVKKFEQHEHAIALECAFFSVLRKPVQLKISAMIDTGKC